MLWIKSAKEGPCSISTSIDFATLQHENTCDGFISVFGQVHLNTHTTNKYFLLSNLQVKVETKVYNGLAIKLVNGLLISGDGQMIQHGTTSSKVDSCIFKLQFSANGVSMKSKVEYISE